MSNFEIKYLPSFLLGKHVGIAVKVFTDGSREAVLKDSFPSVSQTDKLYPTELAAVQAARQRWTNKGR